MANAQIPIPDNIMAPLQVAGMDKYAMDTLPYANGLIMVLIGKAKDNPNESVITQDLYQAMQNTGLTVDDLTRYLLSVDDAIKNVTTSSPTMKGIAGPYRAIYFGLFIMYLKTFAKNPEYCNPQCLGKKIAQYNVSKVQLENAVNLHAFNKNAYALSLKNPPSVPGQLSPWIFVYNDKKKTRLFLTKEDMFNYHGKYGGNPVVNLFKKNKIAMGIGIVSVAGAVVGTTLIAHKFKKKRNEKESAAMEAMEAEAKEDGDGSTTEV